VVPPTCVHVNTRHTASVLGATTTTRGRRHHCSLRTFYYGGHRRRSLCARRHGLTLGKGRGFLDFWQRIFLSSRRVRFSPSQDRSVDFLHSKKLVVNQLRLPSYKYYSRMVFTYKLDRTTVTVGAPSMLAMTTSPASAGTSSSAWTATGSPAPVVVLGSGLLSSAGTCGSAVQDVCRVICDTSSSTVGAGLRLLSVSSPTVSQSSPSP
jgi:hypothetical protein